MLAEEDEHLPEHEALAAQLSQLAPGSAQNLEARFFYEAGYRAALSAAPSTVGAKGGMGWALAVACLLLAIGSGILTSQLPLLYAPRSVQMAEHEPHPAAPAVEPQQVADERSDLPPTKIATRNQHRASVNDSLGEASELPEDEQNATPVRAVGSGDIFPVGRLVSNYVSNWSSKVSNHGGVSIGPIGASWEHLVVTRSESLANNEPSTRVPESELSLPEQPSFRRFDLNPFRQIFTN